MSDDLSRRIPSEHAVPPGASWSRRAEDDASGGSRLVGRLVSPLVAVVPWLMTMGGLLLMSRSYIELQQNLRTPWGWILGGAAVLVLAALVWAALTAWSSVGATVAGVGTVVVGLLLAVPEVQREVFALTQGLVSSFRVSVYTVFSPMTFVLVGSLLLACGLGAAGARRLRR